MKILLDTNVLIDALNQKDDRHVFLREMVVQNHVLASCAVTVAEVYAGMRPHEARSTAALIALLEYYETTQSVAQRAGGIKALWRKRGHVIHIPDALIAAVALEHDLVLATDNRKHFPMPELKLLDLPHPS